jgi:hypothetical protein
VKVIVAELPGKRQHADDERQCEAMQQAQPGQRDSCSVQHRITLSLAVIHKCLP